MHKTRLNMRLEEEKLDALRETAGRLTAEQLGTVTVTDLVEEGIDWVLEKHKAKKRKRRK